MLNIVLTSFCSIKAYVRRGVWFGFLLHGWWAKGTEPLHWAIYAAGAWGFHRMRPWLWPWAALYSAQVAIGALVWNLRDDRGHGWLGGLPVFAGCMALAVALWRARDRFRGGDANG